MAHLLLGRIVPAASESVRHRPAQEQSGYGGSQDNQWERYGKKIQGDERQDGEADQQLAG